MTGIIEKKQNEGRIGQVIRNDIFQRVLIGVLSMLAVFVMISEGAAPKRYKLTLGEKSEFDIHAPRDVENTMKTEELALEMVNEVPPVIKELELANTKMLGNVYDFFDNLNALRTKLIPTLEEDSGTNLKEMFAQENAVSPIPILMDMDEALLTYLFRSETAAEIDLLKERLIREVLPELSTTAVTKENLNQVLADFHLRLEEMLSGIEMQQAAKQILKGILIPNSTVDELATEKQTNELMEAFKLENPVMIYKDERIIRKDDVVTKDQIDVLRRLGYLDEKNGPDYLFLASVFFLVSMLWMIMALFMGNFTKKSFQSRNDLLLITTIVILTVFLAWLSKELLQDYAPYLTIGFIAPVLLAIFLNIQLSIVVNLALTLSIALMFPDNPTFIIMFLINGTFAAFLSTNASQRRKISLAGVVIGVMNILVVTCVGIIEKKDWTTLINEGGFVFINGILSVILAIGLLPFLESIFNMITPLKLLELADPNHPLMQRLLMEAPGTYHHSLMVGNLAEVAVRKIGGNSLLARVGAYFHDVGKLKRPGFFKENQMSENPHDRITPNLSTLVITSHTKDGEELAIKYKLPKVIRDIIVQHHGSTLVAFFYHKARQGEKGLDVKESNFRYEGPKPQTREAAVVLLADSVEAAVRSIQERTRGKIEGLIRKIIKDKLDDGQLDHCDLTLKDLNDIADAFLTVLSGFFHERTEYPELEKKNTLTELDNQVYNILQESKKEKKDEGSHSKQIEEEILSDEGIETAFVDDGANRIED